MLISHPEQVTWARFRRKKRAHSSSYSAENELALHGVVPISMQFTWVL